MREAPVKLKEAAIALDIEVHPGLPAEIDAVAASADPRHLFLRQAWFAAAATGQVSTIIGRRPDGRPIAALPIEASGPRLLGLHAVPGCYWPYRSFALAADAVDEEIIALLGSKAARDALGRLWRIGPVHADDPTAVRLLRLARQAGWTVLTRRIATSFLLDIERAGCDASWPRTSTLRKNRFHEKHLASHGALEWRFVSGGDWTADIFDALAQIEARSWVAARTDGRDAKFLAPQHRRFWEKAALDPALAEMMWAAILFIDGRPAAFSFDLDLPPLKHAIANSYDEEFAKHSPGKVLYYRNLVRGMERGISLVDWGAGDGGYKRTIGAEAGPEILDLLFVRSRTLAMILRPVWSASGQR